MIFQRVVVGPKGQWQPVRETMGSVHLVRHVVRLCLPQMSPGPGVHFTGDFPIVIKIRWKFHSNLMPVVVKWSHTARQLCCRGMCEILWRYHTFQCSYTKTSFHRIWITMERWFAKWAPGYGYFPGCAVTLVIWTRRSQCNRWCPDLPFGRC